MLILERRLGEVVIIHGMIRIKVVEIRDSRVKLGIDAPPEVEVYREEIQHRIDLERGKV